MPPKGVTFLGSQRHVDATCDAMSWAETRLPYTGVNELLVLLGLVFC